MRRVSAPFALRLDALSETLSAEELFYGPLTGVVIGEYVSLVNTCRASVSVLMVAEFEALLRDLASAYIEDLNQRNPSVPWGDLPEKLRETHSLKLGPASSKEKLPGESVAAFHQRIAHRIAADLVRVVSPFTSPGDYDLITAPFESTNSNPEAKQVREMLNRLGVQGFFRHVGVIRAFRREHRLTTELQITDRLDEIVGRRHLYAHGRAASVVPSRVTLESDLSFLKTLARKLETICRSAVRAF